MKLCIVLDDLCCKINIPFCFLALNPDTGSKPHAGDAESVTEDVNGGCTSSYKGTSFCFSDGLLLARRRS